MEFETNFCKSIKDGPQVQQRKWTCPWPRSLQWHRPEQATVSPPTIERGRSMMPPIIEINVVSNDWDLQSSSDQGASTTWLNVSVVNLSVFTFIGSRGQYWLSWCQGTSRLLGSSSVPGSLQSNLGRDFSFAIHILPMLPAGKNPKLWWVEDLRRSCQEVWVLCQVWTLRQWVEEF